MQADAAQEPQSDPKNGDKAIETARLSLGEDENLSANSNMDVDAVLGTVDVADSSGGVDLESLFSFGGSESGGPDKASEGYVQYQVTQSPGVSDPAQTTREFPNPENGQKSLPDREFNAGNNLDLGGIEVGNSTTTVSVNSETRTILTLDPDLYGPVDLADLLKTEDIPFTETADGLIVVTLTGEQFVELSQTIEALLANNTNRGDESSGNEHTTTPITGSDADDFIVATERGGAILGLGGNDVLVGNVAQDELIGGSGNDTADYSRSAQGVEVNLASGDGNGGDASGDSYESIENVIGSHAGDSLSGDDFNNLLFGNNGDDTLFGAGGYDRIEGGAGGDHIDGGDGDTDLAEYRNSDAGVTISLVADTASGGHAEGDELDNIESVSGSLFDDSLTGDNQANRLGGLFGDDKLFGLGGNDTLLGGSGADLLDGGSGTDTADYTASTEGVCVFLDTGRAIHGEAEGDTLVSIENLAGSAHDDLLVGDAGNNRLTGRDGDDTLRGNDGNDRLIGGLGADHHDGGDGNRDTADYSAATEKVGVDLVNGGFEGEARGDTFDSVEFVTASEFHDTIFGNDVVNRLVGLDGCDVLVGRGGNDTLLGGLDDDILNGGSGNDVFIFEGTTDSDIIEDFEAGLGRTDRVWLKNGEFGTFQEVQNALTQTDNGALLTHSTGDILFQNLDVAELVADDFILA